MKNLKTRYGMLQVPNDDNDIICRFLDRYGEWSWLETRFVANLLEDGARVLDVGAFVGTFGLGIAKQRRLEKLTFVEANTHIVGCLRQNAAENVTCPFEVIEGLVAGSRDVSRVGHADIGNLGSASFSADGAGPVTILASEQVFSLADLRLRDHAFDLIKLDIEGMELEALQSDAETLAQGNTTLWIECNENPRSLDVAALLLSWGVRVFYYAYPSYNPGNFNRDPEPLFPMAYEAGLLAAPKAVPQLPRGSGAADCILKEIRSKDDLKEALWRTPRWGRPEWERTKTRLDFAAAVCRSLRDEEFSSFLNGSQTSGSNTSETVWQRLGAAETALREAQALVAEERQARLSVEDALKKTEILALSRYDEMKAEHTIRETNEVAYREVEKLALERLAELQAERSIRENAETALRYAEHLAVERLAEYDAEHTRREVAEAACREWETVAAGRLNDLTAEHTLRVCAETAHRDMEVLVGEKMQELTIEREQREAAEHALHQSELALEVSETALREAGLALKGLEAIAAAQMDEIGREHDKRILVEQTISELIRSLVLTEQRADAAESGLAAASARGLSHLAALGQLREQTGSQHAALQMQLMTLKHDLDARTMEQEAQHAALERDLGRERAAVDLLQKSVLHEREKARDAQNAADDIRFSTAWRLSAPARAVVDRIPILHATLRHGRLIARKVIHGQTF